MQAIIFNLQKLTAEIQLPSTNKIHFCRPNLLLYYLLISATLKHTMTRLVIIKSCQIIAQVRDLLKHTLLRSRILLLMNSSISFSLVSKTGIAVCAMHPRDCSTAGKCVFSSSMSTSLCKLRK